MGDLWSTGERKAELKGQPLDPTCPAAKVGMFLFAQKPPLTNRPQALAPEAAGRKGGQDRWEADAAWAWWSSLVLDQSLHLVYEVPGQLQDLLGVVSLGHF